MVHRADASGSETFGGDNESDWAADEQDGTRWDDSGAYADDFEGQQSGDVDKYVYGGGNQQKVVDMLVETTEKAMKHIPGFVSASIHKSLDGVRGLLPATS